MKKALFYIVLLAVVAGCEDVIDVNLNESEPKLVIEATLSVLEDGTANNFVKLTTTAPFFNNSVPVIENALVEISDESGTVFTFVYFENGFYRNNFIPQQNIEYTLQITYNNEVYRATAQLQTTVPLEFVTQRNDGGFGGDEIELKAFFTDPAGQDNYYFFEGLSQAGNVYDTFYDQFFDGNAIFGFYLVEDLEAGDVVTFNLSGVDESFYSFMFTLLQQTGSSNDGPFETQPATVRGNIRNVSNQENFPLGYFRISEVSTLVYTVQ